MANEFERELSTHVDVIASTADIDSYGESIDQSTWVLDRYRRNPVVLWAHNSKELPIGFATRLRVEDGALRARLNFVSAVANPKAPQVYSGFQERSIRAVSVGFIPRRFSVQLIDDREIVTLHDNELLEISPAPVPANPFALEEASKAIAQGGEKQRNDDMSDALNARIRDLEIECHKAKLDMTAKDAEIGRLQKDLAAANAKMSSFQELNDGKEKALSEAREQLAKAQLDLVDRDLNDLIGKKISPAEKPGFVALYKADQTAYAAQLDAVRARADMGLLDTKSVMGNEAPTVGTAAAGADANNEFDAQVGKSIASFMAEA